MANLKLLAGVARVLDATPISDAAIHWCFNDERYGAAMAVMCKLGDELLRTRSRLHRGPHMEVQYELVSYGIPTTALPFNADGDMRKKDVYMNFLKMLRAREERIRTGQDVNHIILPSNCDCLFGRGKPVRTHQGNLRLGFLVEEKLRDYLKGGRPQKIAIANSVYEAMTDGSARFLKQDDDGVYVEVDQNTAISKIEHFFRNRKQLVSSNATSLNKTAVEGGGVKKRPAVSYT